MATIPRSVIDAATIEINALSADAQERVRRVLERITWMPDNIARCRELVLEALQIVLPAYTDAAAQVSADLYDAMRAVQVGEALGAVAASGYNRDATAGAVRALVQRIVDGARVESFNELVLERVDYEIKLASNMGTVYNVQRDPLEPRYARVPSGAETCDFCLMLASRGFVYRSAESASHSHAHCDCRIVAGWGDMGVEGYDLNEVYDRWQERIDEMAWERSDRNGTGFEDEREKILKGYRSSAAHAKRAVRVRS